MVKRKNIVLLVMLGLLIGSCGGNGGERPALSQEEKLGDRLFTQNCASCHSSRGDTIIVGPSLAGIALDAGAKVAGLDARGYIEASIMEPSAFVSEGFSDLMPKTFGKTLTGEELDALVTFLLGLE